MVRVAVIGAGLGGIAVAALLRRAGFTDVVVLERAPRIGGVWRDNRYPGCACDVPAPLYSYSFFPNPHWSRRFPPHHEILAYVRRCADELGVTPHVRLNTEVVAARWESGAWHLSTADGTEIVADVLVPAVGQLSRPVIPVLPGAATFAGRALHTTGWDDTIEVTGRRVAVIGTGASAIQLVPAIAGDAAHVTVFQRTAPWTLPKPDRRYGRVRRLLYRRVPGAMWPARAATLLLAWFATRAITGDRVARALVTGISAAQRRWQVRDPALRARVTPDIPLGCKRTLFTTAWLPALGRPDVDLVTEKIVGVEPAGVRTADGVLHEADLLVYGTGFAATEFVAPMRITGRGGVTLRETWRDGARAYLGMAVPDFPNMFLVYGPNTNTGTTSVVVFQEAQARYVVQAVRALAAGAGPLCVSPAVAATHDAELQRRLAGSVWTGCESWYLGPGGRVVTNWPGTGGEYVRRTARFDPADYSA
ncbi:cation diffusion facilitator CzcD-associated flavoprotein CzcO [Catenuloplanes nepalensis]|uniref:Cation diffusion facilitator CzcD-associated flavoprotein CzcO n=1 Tax=Catenuloplanes nepalensis TaxID=587533 RepID=A0ABT9MWX4_9ACTN|nr:NAD(P)/FAD-dependent oxidoreductase [Catenuloplanes nepalensis]MDP9795932.1 cation diffusion facilitator CzcD-associated flavoprotein CzcO [Catenuloplanes nepalensis]